jgi:DNA-binding NtrC family response regulator
MKLREVDRAYIEAMLLRLGGNKARTAQALGISEKTLYNKLHRYAAEDGRKGGDDDDDDVTPLAAGG